MKVCEYFEREKAGDLKDSMLLALSLASICLHTRTHNLQSEQSRIRNQIDGNYNAIYASSYHVAYSCIPQSNRHLVRPVQPH